MRGKAVAKIEVVSLQGNAEAGDQLKAIVERIENVNEEIKAYNDDKKEIFAEAKGAGFDTAVIKKLIKLRSIPHADRQQADAVLELYAQAIGFPL
jgi:uncharacterized protein (UPF0335 family)